MEITINNRPNNIVNNTGVYSAVKVRNAPTAPTETDHLQLNNVVTSQPEYEFEATEDTQIIYGETPSEPTDSVVEIASTRSSITDTYKAYQTKLKDLGFYIGSINGDLSTSVSKKAILSFQKLYGMNETGTMDGNTIGNLTNIYIQYSNVYTATENLPSSYCLDAEQKRNVARVWVFLKNRMGLNSVQASGAMGNIMQESRFTPNNANDNKYPGDYNPNYNFSVSDNTAYGIMQWCIQARKEKLASTAADYGMSVSNINVQLACMKAESTDADICKSGWGNLRKCTSVASAATVFKNEIEQCNDDSLQDRINYAQVFYNVLV